jgi:oligosaccharide repeat unit polymerase
LLPIDRASTAKGSIMNTAQRSQVQISLFPASILTIVLAILFFAVLNGGSRSFVFLLLLLLSAGVVWIVWRIAAKANEWTLLGDFFAPQVAFPIAYVVWFTLGSIDVIDLPDSISFGAFAPIPPRMWLYYGVGLIGYLAGLFLLWPGVSSRRTPSSARNNWEPSAFWVVASLLACSTFVSYGALAYMYGIPSMHASAEEIRLKWVGWTHTVFICSAWLLIILTPVYIWGQRASRTEKILSALLVAFVTLLLLSTAGRTNVVVPFLTVLVGMHYLRVHLSLKRMLLVGMLALAVLGLFGYARDSVFGESDPGSWLSAAGVPEWIVPPLYGVLYVRYSIATFRDIADAIPLHVPYQAGALTFEPLAHLLLRTTQGTSDLFFKNILGNDFVGGGQPATLLGPLYGDFGLPGVFVGMLLFGVIAGWTYLRMFRFQRPIDVILYAWVLQTGLFGLFAGPFPSNVTWLVPVFCILFNWIFHVFVVSRQISCASEVPG